MKFKERLKRSFPKSSFLDRNRNIDKDRAKKCEIHDIENDTRHLKKDPLTVFKFKPPNIIKKDRRSFKTSTQQSRKVLQKGDRPSNEINFKLNKRDHNLKMDLAVVHKTTTCSKSAKIEVHMNSLISSGKEIVNFSDLVKPVNFPIRYKQKRMKQIKQCTMNDDDNDDVSEDNEQFEGEIELDDKVSAIKDITGQILDKDKARQGDKADALNRETSPTCSDIYGNDEMDNITFGLCANLKNLQQNQTKDSDVQLDSNGLVNGLKELGQKVDGVSDNSKIRKFGVDLTNGRTELMKEQKGIADTENETDFDNPWVLQEHLRGNDIEVLDTESYCSVEVVNKSLQHLQVDCTEDPLYSSLGFDVSPNDVLNNMPNHRKLTRTHSIDSIDSFGSSVHSVHSNELFFSDSEAEHDTDQITTMEKKSISKKKQIIPYSLCEQISDGTDTPKKSRTFNSKSLEDKINEFAKQILQKVDGKDNEDQPDKKKEFVTKHSRSLDESLASDNGKKDLSKKLKQNRRSLDSTINQKDYMYQTEDLGKRKSLLTSSTEQLLTPVLEAEGKVSAKMKTPKKSDVDDSKKFYTLPNPRKRKSATPVRRKSSRLGSISKMFSEKAYSLTNLKLGSSFKLRNETDGSNSDTTWSQLSLSANSLANMMVKKASNISTMIRKRSNSNTLSTDFADSPFNTFGRKKNKVKEKDGVELVYEKVLVTVPRKRQVTAREEKSMEKRLKLNLDLTIDSPDSRLSHSVSQSSSFGINLVKSDSQSPLRSPTLLDEIMKSVDAAGVHRMCSMVGEDDDDELSSDYDSSSGSSLFLFQKRYSLVSDISDKKRDSLMLTYCKVCGRIRDLSDGSTESSDGDVKVSPRHSVSLCDLTNPCSCGKRKNGHRRFSKQNQTGERRSWVIIGDDDKVDITRPLGLPKSISLGGKSFSSNDLRSDRSLCSLTNENVEGSNTDNSKALDAIPGSLLRHEPLLDLSVDSLNKTTESEFDFVRREERKSCSCGSLGDRKCGRKSDEDSFHSCTDISETDITDVQSTRNEKHRPKSHSCGNLLSPNDIFVCDQLSKNELVRKEVRKIKVKSMSSSHDVLNQIGDIDAIDINVDEIESKANVVKENLYNEMKHGKSDENCESSNDNAEVMNDSTKHIEEMKPKNRKLSDQNSKEKNLENENSRKALNEIDKTFRVPNIVIHNAKVTSKPPLPFHKTHKRFQSLCDVNPSENKENLQRHRHSLGDDLSDNFDVTKAFNVDIGKPQSDKMTGQSKTKPSRFLFDEKTITLISNQKKSDDRRKSLSSNNISDLAKLQTSPKEKLLSMHSMNTINQDIYTDDVFPPNSPNMPNKIPRPLCDNRDYASLTSPGLESHELPPFGEECVYKYDVCLGYLLHSIEYDDTVVCMYSLQRNKQFMESMITPLAALPGSPNSRPSSQHNSTVNKPKTSSKLRQEETPNPAAPITKVPSVRLAHAGHVIRTVLLARAPHMIRDRKFHLRTYRRCMVGTEMVDWLLQQSPLVHSRTQAVGMWQALVEEGVVVHVCHEHQFKDKYLFYRFHEDDEGVSTVPSTATKRECEDDLQDVFLMLAQIGPDAMMRMILRKPAHERTTEDLEIIYEELLHIKALSHLSTMVKRELASVLVFESHDKAGTVLFNQGDEGKSWYIILKGSVNVVIYGKGVVCTLHEGDDFGKLALVNDAPRAATIVLRDDNCHFLRVDKDDFNRILRDVEANTVRLKEHGQDVLVLEKIPSNTQTADGSVQAHYKYSVMAGTPEKMLEHLLESRLENRNEQEIDGFLEDFLLTHVIFMPYNHLCPVLLSHYHSSTADSSEQEGLEFMLNHKKCVLHFVQEWVNIVGAPFKQDHTINAFLEELLSCVMDDLEDYPTLKDDLVALETILNAQSESPNSKLKKRPSATFLLSKKQSKESLYEAPRKRTPSKPTDEFVFRVYCADHSYTTLKLPMAARVEQVLSSTIEKLGLGEDLILCEVKSTGERIIFKENDLCVTTGLSINGQLFVTPKEHLDALTPLPEQEGPGEGTFTTIEMFSSREMAYQMTLYDWELFTCVQEYELIYQVFGRHKFGKITANLDIFLRRFNEIQFWIVSEMVLASNLSKRVSLLRKFIKLAAHCKEYRNLNSFFAIVMGLSNIAVSRLSQTWEKLPSKFKKMFADFEMLMDPSRNHRVYRLSVAKMLPPIIPFMPLLMKDMTFTHEGNKTYFDGLVNFEKMHMIAQTLKTVQFCRSSALDIEAPNTMKSSDTADYIRDLHVIDNQRLLTKLSHKLEPRKT